MKRTLLILLIFQLSSSAFSQDTFVYVSDAGNFSAPPWQILKFDENGQNPEVFIDTNLNWPQDIVFLDNSDTVLISNLNSGRINRHSATTGDFIDSFATSIAQPTRMKIGADNYLYVLQWSDDGRVKRYELDGTFVDDFTNVGVPQSIGLDWDADGNLYVSSFSGQYVRKFDANGNFQLDPTVAGGVNIDITRDLVFQFGLQTDSVFAGQFNPGGVASNGYDRLGAYGLSGGVFRFLLDFNDNGAVDAAGETIVSNVQVNALPLAGDFDNDNAGDEVGLFDGVTWWLDTNGDNLLDISFSGNMRGLPIAGDFDGDGLTDLAAHVASTDIFNFDLVLFLFLSLQGIC